MKMADLLRRFRGPLVIILGVLIANSLYLTGVFTANPVNQFSGLAINETAGVLSGYNTIDPNNAYTTQALGHAAARDIAHGVTPWWNYNEQVGAPLAGEMQSAALFVPFNLLLGLAGGLLFFHLFLEVVAGVAVYYLLRKLRCSELAAILGGILFTLNGTFSWLTNAAFNPVAFLPVMLLGVELVREDFRTHKKRGWIVLALGLAFSLYAGFPETAFLDCLLVAAWGVVRAFQLRHEQWLRFLLWVALGAGVGLLLAAPILAAFAGFYPHANVGIHSGALKTYGLPHAALPALFMPYMYGEIFGFTSYDHTGILGQFWGSVGGYLTFSVLFLAIMGVLAARKNRANRPLIIMLAAWVVITISRVYGFPEIAKVLNVIPGISAVAFYRYIPPTFELAAIILAMVGLDNLLKDGKVRKKHVLAVSGALVLFVLLLLPFSLHETHRLYLAPHHRLWLAASVAWGVGSIGAVAATLLFFKKYAKVLLPLILLADALLMFVVPQLSAPRSATVDMQPVNFLRANLGTERFYSLGAIMPNYSSYFNIASINTNDLPVAKNWTNYVTKHLNSNVSPLDGFTGVDQIDPNGITPLQAFFENMPNYEQVGVKYLVVRKDAVPPVLTATGQLSLVFADTYYQVYQLPHPSPYFALAGSACTLTVQDKAHVSTSCPHATTLIRSELYMPGWTATVNGRSIVVCQTGPLFQAITVPAGAATISFAFAPPHIRLAEAAAALGVLVIIGVVAKERYLSPTKLK